MGAIIEVFPGRPESRRRNSARTAWRRSPVPGSGSVRVRPARLEDFAAIRAVRRETHAAPWTLKQLEARRHAFAEGQLVAEREGEIVGAASCLVVRWNEYALEHTWRSVTGDGLFTTHDPAGRTLYCAETVAADLPRHGAAVERALCQAQKRLCRKLNLRRVIDIVRLPGYRAFKDEMPADVYASRVIWGDLAEPSLTFLTSQGFQYCGIIRDYRPEDLDSCGNAALVAWLNPFYSPTEPPAKAQTERRKCA